MAKRVSKMTTRLAEFLKIISVLWCLEGYADDYQGGCDGKIGELRNTNVYVLARLTTT